MALDRTMIRDLRGKAHQLHPVVMIASKGLTENVMNEIELALNTHELIKIRINDEEKQRQQLTEEICAATRAELVQKIGKVVVLFRAKKAKTT